MIERHKKLIIILTAYIVVAALVVIPFTIRTDKSAITVVFLVASLILLLVLNILNGKTMKLKYLMSQAKNKNLAQEYLDKLKLLKEQKIIIFIVFCALAILTIILGVYFAVK